ncbi:MAG: hypothetical protein Udaeo2_21280 [Candidatus Udaeobacter sp.]|nr:MAG: hypothetical protein Udaeo2_21280 [Candidatus Udaeobacter sp.]
MSKRRVYLAGLALQLFLIITVSSRDTFWLLSTSRTVFPERSKNFWQRAEQIASTPLGQGLPRSNPARQILTGYLHLSGIEAGYGFFAPNIPNSYKLVFELRFPDGRVEYRLPRVSNAASVLRIAGLLDMIGRTRSEAFRQTIVKMLADAVWREHADATMIRATFGSVVLPSAPEFERGKRESYEFLYAYDFSVSDKATEQSTP